MLNKLSEEALVELLLKKTEQAFDYLYENYSAALLGVILRITPEKDLAEDILQESFIKIWNNISSYDASKGKLFTWMLNLTRNHTIDTLRSKQIAIRSQIQDLENSVYTIDKEMNTQISSDTIGLKQLLNKLSDEQRFIIEWMYFKGFTQQEIADKFNLPLGTIKTRARSAIIKLREYFDINLNQP